MKSTWWMKRRVVQLYAAGGSLFLLGSCGLSDQQLAAIAGSALTTGLNTLVTQGVALLVAGLGGTGTA